MDCNILIDYVCVHFICTRAITHVSMRDGHHFLGVFVSCMVYNCQYQRSLSPLQFGVVIGSG